MIGAGGERARLPSPLEAANAEVARLSEAYKERAVKLTAGGGEDRWAECPGSYIGSTQPPRPACWACLTTPVELGWTLVELGWTLR